MALLLLAFAALAHTLINGGIAFFIFKRFTARHSAAVAAFWLTFGVVGVRYEVKSSETEEVLATLAPFVGAVMGLVLLWWWMFRRQPTGAETEA